jgi:hypothetical protein
MPNPIRSGSPRGFAVAGVIAILGLPVAGGAQQASYESLNACQRVPGADVAAAVSGKAIDERPVNVKGLTAARCVYGVEVAGTRRAFVVWVNPAADFDGLRQASEPPVTDVKGVGDEAFAVTDKDTKRVQLTARTRGKVTVQVTSERMDWAQAVAKVALSKF